jgi:ectoine hydroxylase-related dioxygenase (phytanoyl-CoA dioxygenase family)
MAMLNGSQVAQFHRDGFVSVPGTFSQAEVDILIANIGNQKRVGKHEFALADATGRASKLSLWGDIGDDVFGAVSASPRVVVPVEILLGEEVYHWHSKVMLKEPKVGGAWEWHQDYGYWYNDTCLYPQMMSVFIALDKATQENGCLKVLVGSHKLGRINHGTVGAQAGADPERVALIEKRLPTQLCEMEPGTALYFHGNLLHASGPNRSDRPRRTYICTYNALSNAPADPQRGHGKPERIRLAPDDAVLRFGNATNR